MPTSSPVPIWPIAGAPTSGPNPTPNLIALINYYVGLLVRQYANKPNAQRTIAILGKQVIMDDLVSQLLQAFNLDTAVGPQLDVVGKYIGTTRQLGVALSSVDYFGCVDTRGTGFPQNIFGCGDTVNPTVNDNVLMWDNTISQQQSTALPDEQYRTVLELKALLNTSNGTLASVQQSFYQLFGLPNQTGSGADLGQFHPTVISGQVSAVTVLHPTGNGYQVGFGPYVWFPTGGGTGALGRAIIGGPGPTNGRIIGVNLISMGGNYTSIPSVALSGTLIQVIDNANMSVTYNVLPSALAVSQANLEVFLPKPMGSSITVNMF